MNYFKAVVYGLGCFVAEPSTPVKIIKEEIIINILVKHSERQNKPYFNQNYCHSWRANGQTPHLRAQHLGTHWTWNFSPEQRMYSIASGGECVTLSVPMATCVKPSGVLQVMHPAILPPSARIR